MMIKIVPQVSMIMTDIEPPAGYSMKLAAYELFPGTIRDWQPIDFINLVYSSIFEKLNILRAELWQSIFATCVTANEKENKEYDEEDKYTFNCKIEATVLLMRGDEIQSHIPVDGFVGMLQLGKGLFEPGYDGEDPYQVLLSFLKQDSAEIFDKFLTHIFFLARELLNIPVSIAPPCKEKTWNNTDVNGASKQVPDLEVFGNGDYFQLIYKASSKSEGWMKSTKAMEIPNLGCFVQVTTQQKNPDGSYVVAEALAFARGAVILVQADDSKSLVTSEVREGYAAEQLRLLSKKDGTI